MLEFCLPLERRSKGNRSKKPYQDAFGTQLAFKTFLAALDTHKTNHLQRDSKSRRGKVAGGCTVRQWSIRRFFNKAFQTGEYHKSGNSKKRSMFSRDCQRPPRDRSRDYRKIHRDAETIDLGFFLLTPYLRSLRLCVFYDSLWPGLWVVSDGLWKNPRVFEH